MIIFLTIAVIILAIIDLYYYACLKETYKALKLINENTKVLKEKMIEVMNK